MRNIFSKKELREFGFIISFGFPIIIGWIIPLFWGHEFKTWTIFVSIPFLIFTISNPNLLAYPYKYWMIFGEILGWINSKIILGVIFLIILIPISFIMKIFGYDPLKLKNRGKNSYKEFKNQINSDLRRIF